MTNEYYVRHPLWDKAYDELMEEINMKNTKLTPDELYTLKEIANNPISLSAFSGMIFNKYIELNCKEPVSVDELVKNAVMIKQHVKHLAQVQEVYEQTDKIEPKKEEPELDLDV